jgi:PA14 domain
MTPVEVMGKTIPAWVLDEKSGPLTFKTQTPGPLPPDGSVYLSVSYLDQGYGKLSVQLITAGNKPILPDRFLGLTRTNSGQTVTARMRFVKIPSSAKNNWSIRITMERADRETLAVGAVTLRDTPFDDPAFKLVISDPWKGPYRGPGIKPRDNSTLKGKVMAGYQGWFRTPNDLEGKGWVHWGNIQAGTFSVDMWPDTSQYPPSVLEKAGEVKLTSGKQARLFSSTWPEVVDTHFRWMREHDIDGAFLQRFVSNKFHSISGGPEWVMSNVRAAANREGRIWAIEYDISGCPDHQLLEMMKTDWKWLVDGFRVLEDPNYAREGSKPVVFIWGLPFSNREISTKTANAVVDFFKNDPKYGGNHVIGGIPSGWRKMDVAWQNHFKKYETILTWMPKSHTQDLADFSKLGINYYPHVKPGFSWANLKHLPTGDDSTGYTPREGGRFYWKQLTDAAQSGGDRLFVGMFDEYDEATAIMPMSDDTPDTPERPGVGATFYDGANAAESGDFVLLPTATLELGDSSPSKNTQSDNFFVRMGGRITFPEAGAYTFSAQSAAGDGVELFLNGQSVLHSASIKDAPVSAGQSVIVEKGETMAFRLECRHRTGKGTLQLLWETPRMRRQQVAATALHDAWGRFITNEGQPSDWWLQLTRKGKELVTGKRNPNEPSPEPGEKSIRLQIAPTSQNQPNEPNNRPH